MSGNLSIIIENKPSLHSLLIFCAFEKGFLIPIGNILHSNNELRSFSEFTEAVRLAINCDSLLRNIIENVVDQLQACTFAIVDSDSDQKIILTRQFELLSHKQFSMNDYYFAHESYPKCRL